MSQTPTPPPPGFPVDEPRPPGEAGPPPTVDDPSGTPNNGEPPVMTSPVEDQPFDPPKDAAIVAIGLTKRYGQLRAVDNVDFFVPKGSIYGLIGPNGAGKSTLMSMSASLLLPTEGRIMVEGHDPITESASVRLKIGYMPDGLGVYEGMNVSEYLEFFAAAYRIPRDEWADLTSSLLELVELEVKRTAQVNSLSRGMKQRLSLARALVHSPSLLILDEPASGLDPRARIELRHLMENLNAMGKTILVSSHILTELQEVCTHVGIMEAGRVLVSGSPNEIAERLKPEPRVRVAFEDGTSEELTVPPDTTRAELLRRLVNDDPRQVVEFTDLSNGLEDVFLSVTEGIVQ